MKKIFLLLFFSFCILNVFSGEKGKKRAEDFCVDQVFCVDDKFHLDEDFLYNDNFVFWFTDNGDINFLQKSHSGEAIEIDLKFKVTKFVGIENNDQRENGVVSAKILVLDKESIEHSIEVRATTEKECTYRFSVFVDTK